MALLPPGGSGELLAWGTCSLQGQSCIWTCINKSPDSLRRTEALSCCTCDAVTFQQPSETQGGWSPTPGGCVQELWVIFRLVGVSEKMALAARHLRLAASVLCCLLLMLFFWRIRRHGGTRRGSQLSVRGQGSMCACSPSRAHWCVHPPHEDKHTCCKLIRKCPS